MQPICEVEHARHAGENLPPVFLPVQKRLQPHTYTAGMLCTYTDYVKSFVW